MLLSSEKFKYLEQVKGLLPEDSIPAYRIMKDLGPDEDISGRFILRSALKNEGQRDKLQSGKSLSLGGIDSWQKLSDAWASIQKQEALDEVILQEEINWKIHVTLMVEKDFFFAELKSRSGSPQFIYWTPLGQSLSPFTNKLKTFLSHMDSVLMQEPFWLLEAGIENDKIHLFQIHPIGETIVSQVFSGDLAPQIISSRLRFSKSAGVLNLLKTEWQARKFRDSIHKASLTPSSIFMNWEFLFHYFRLYCMINQLRPQAQSFAGFLSASYQEGWLSSLVKKHLELANFFRQGESFDPMKLGFEGEGQIFIGKGVVEGVVGEDILVFDEIPLSCIYQKSKPRFILTKEVGMLSHPVLACVENGISLVLGIKQLPQKGERIYLDFERRILEVK